MAFSKFPPFSIWERGVDVLHQLSIYVQNCSRSFFVLFFANVDQCHVLENPIVPKKRLAFKYARGHCRQNYDHNLHMHSFVREIVISTRYIEKFEQNLFVFSTLIHTYLQKKLRSTLLRL